VRGRRWLLCLLPLPWLALVWLAAYLVLQVGLEHDVAWLIYQHGSALFDLGIAVGLLLTAVAGLPAAAFVGAVLTRLRRRRWRGATLLLVGSLLLAAALAAVWLSYFPGRQPEQRYSWGGWYAIWPAGAYAVGLLVLATYLVVRIFRLGRWGIGRIFGRARAA
jgi:hypothetical protein